MQIVVKILNKFGIVSQPFAGHRLKLPTRPSLCHVSFSTISGGEVNRFCLRIFNFGKQSRTSKKVAAERTSVLCTNIV